MNKLCKGLLASVALLAAPFTQAAVIEWSYNVTTIWTGATFTSGTGSVSVNDSLISWGTTGGNFSGPNPNRSALQLSNSPASGTVTTNGALEATNTITHFNNPISISNRLLDSASLKTTLNLTPLLPVPGAPLPSLETLLSIDFVETPNSLPCNFPTVTFCDDIFVLDAGALSSEFTYDGITYFLQIVELSGNLATLPNATCAKAGVANGCVGFTTPERAATPAQFGFFITTVSEPAMLGIFGLGLLGLRAFGRRRSTKK